MSVSYSFYGRILRLDCIGEYTTDELKGVYETALLDPAFPADPAFLMDVSLSKSLANRSSQDIQETAYFLGSQGNLVGKRCAIVAPIDLYYGLMRMASVFAEEFGVDTEVFRTEEEALIWLGV